MMEKMMTTTNKQYYLFAKLADDVAEITKKLEVSEEREE